MPSVFSCVNTCPKPLPRRNVAGSWRKRRWKNFPPRSRKIRTSSRSPCLLREKQKSRLTESVRKNGLFYKWNIDARRKKCYIIWRRTKRMIEIGINDFPLFVDTISAISGFSEEAKLNFDGEGMTCFAKNKARTIRLSSFTNSVKTVN